MGVEYFLGIDSDFGFFKSAFTRSNIKDIYTRFKKVLTDYSWYFSIELSKSLDTYTWSKLNSLKDTDVYALFKEQLKHEFKPSTIKIMSYLLTELKKPQKKLYNMVVFPSINQALEDLGEKSSVHDRLVSEIFKVPFDTFLQKMEFQFDPEYSTPFPGLKRADSDQGSLMTALVNFLTLNPLQVKYPLPELKNYRLYQGGIVIVQGSVHYILHVAYEYIGVLQLNFQTGDCKVGFIGYSDDVHNLYPMSSFDERFETGVLKLYPFTIVTQQEAPLTGTEVDNPKTVLSRFDITKKVVIETTQKIYMLVAQSISVVKNGVTIAYDGLIFLPTATMETALVVYTSIGSGAKFVYQAGSAVVETTVSLIKVGLYGVIGIGIVYAVSQLDLKKRRIK